MLDKIKCKFSKFFKLLKNSFTNNKKFILSVILLFVTTFFIMFSIISCFNTKNASAMSTPNINAPIGSIDNGYNFDNYYCSYFNNFTVNSYTSFTSSAYDLDYIGIGKISPYFLYEPTLSGPLLLPLYSSPMRNTENNNYTVISTSCNSFSNSSSALQDTYYNDGSGGLTGIRQRMQGNSFRNVFMQSSIVNYSLGSASTLYINTSELVDKDIPFTVSLNLGTYNGTDRNPYLTNYEKQQMFNDCSVGLFIDFEILSNVNDKDDGDGNDFIRWSDFQSVPLTYNNSYQFSSYFNLSNFYDYINFHGAQHNYCYYFKSLSFTFVFFCRPLGYTDAKLLELYNAVNNTNYTDIKWLKEYNLRKCLNYYVGLTNGIYKDNSFMSEGTYYSNLYNPTTTNYYPIFNDSFIVDLPTYRVADTDYSKYLNRTRSGMDLFLHETSNADFAIIGKFFNSLFDLEIIPYISIGNLLLFSFGIILFILFVRLFR